MILKDTLCICRSTVKNVTPCPASCVILCALIIAKNTVDGSAGFQSRSGAYGDFVLRTLLWSVSLALYRLNWL